MRYSQAPGPGDSPPRSRSTALVPPLARHWAVATRRTKGVFLSAKSPARCRISCSRVTPYGGANTGNPALERSPPQHRVGGQLLLAARPEGASRPARRARRGGRDRRDHPLEPPPQALGLRGARALRRGAASAPNGTPGLLGERPGRAVRLWRAPGRWRANALPGDGAVARRRRAAHPLAGGPGDRGHGAALPRRAAARARQPDGRRPRGRPPGDPERPDAPVGAAGLQALAARARNADRDRRPRAPARLRRCLNTKLVGAHPPPTSASRSDTMMRAAASISARCEKAWGKLPRCLPVLVSNSSAYRPSGVATRSRRSIRSRARCSSPTIARPETSQNEQIRKLPSLPARPSSVSSVL